MMHKPGTIKLKVFSTLMQWILKFAKGIAVAEWVNCISIHDPSETGVKLCGEQL